MKRCPDAAEPLVFKRNRLPTRYCFAAAAVAASASALEPNTKDLHSNLPNTALSQFLPSGLLRGESKSRIDPLSANLLRDVARGGSATGAGRTAIAAMKVDVFPKSVTASSINLWPRRLNLAQLTFGTGRRRRSYVESHGKIGLFWPLCG